MLWNLLSIRGGVCYLLCFRGDHLPVELNCFFGVLLNSKRQLALFPAETSQLGIKVRDHWEYYQKSSQLRIFDTPRAGFESVRNLCSGLVEWRCVVVVITTPRRRVKSSHWLTSPQHCCFIEYGIYLRRIKILLKDRN